MEHDEMVIFQLITNAGMARSDIFEAWQYCCEGEHEKADECLKNATDNLLEAHKVQTDLIQKEAAGEKMVVQLLMVHAQDHLMTSLLAKDLMEQMIFMQKNIQELTKKVNELAR